jgi:hypothetical protein
LFERASQCKRIPPPGSVFSPSERAAPPLSRLPAMDRRLARRNLRTALITAVIGLLMFALTFVAALLYVE